MSNVLPTVFAGYAERGYLDTYDLVRLERHGISVAEFEQYAAFRNNQEK